ncbi:MAG: EMC3/TMCO1 family protein [Candidatus Woesearchaeota archaeon]|nr:EMC3/TMCO1 family protein [Candidatus Woesearchaeota archaeon]
MITANAILDPVFMPILKISPLLAIAAISFLITLIITFIYKWTTNQKLMKELKDKLGSYQQQMKEAKNDQKKLMQMNAEVMKINGDYMKYSLKSTLISWIPILIIFAWMSSNLAYYPIAPGQEFNLTVKFAPGTTGNMSISATPNLLIAGETTRQIENSMVQWTVLGTEGDYTIDLDFENSTYQKKVKITTGTKYEAPVERGTGKIKSIEVGNKPIVAVNIFGLKLGWFWTYFILAIFFNSMLRKLLKIY